MEKLISKGWHLKHGLKDLYIREVRHTCTGFDIFWGTRSQAFTYTTQQVAVVMKRSLELYGCGNLYLVEEG
ncbi:TPA: hypothetical protein ACGO62_001100 [Streptococcus suis]